MRRIAAAGLVCALLALPACSGQAQHDRVTVLAAASLTEAFQAIGKDFERENPDVSVRFSFGPSDGLATQIQDGAPADVFASASEQWMDAVQSRPGVSYRTDFVTNRWYVIGDGPSNAVSCPPLASRVTLSRATFAPNRLVMFWAKMDMRRDRLQEPNGDG